MAGKKQLPPVRLVDDGEHFAEAKSLSDAFRDGDRLQELLAKRRILIAHIENENTLPRDLNALMRQDDELSKQITEEKAIRVDVLARKRMEVANAGDGNEVFDPYSA